MCDRIGRLYLGANYSLGEQLIYGQAAGYN
jgi:hypothetical protein